MYQLIHENGDVLLTYLHEPKQKYLIKQAKKSNLPRLKYFKLITQRESKPCLKTRLNCWARFGDGEENDDAFIEKKGFMFQPIGFARLHTSWGWGGQTLLNAEGAYNG